MSAATAALSHPRRPRVSRKLVLRRTLIALHHFDLFRTRRFEPRTPAFLDPAAHPNAAPGQRLRLDACGRKHPFVALGDGDGEVLGPPSAEVDVDRAAAFAYRQHVALNDREPPSLTCDRRRIVGSPQGIIRI